MNAIVLILVGLVLCLVGARSLRLVVLAAGFGAGWVLAEAFGASFTTALITAVAVAVAAYLLTWLLSRFLLLIAGGLIGAAIGAKLFVAVDGDSWVLALVTVPCIAIVAALLAVRFHHGFMVWGTAAAGAGLILSGVARLGPEATNHLRHPESAIGAAFLIIAWLILTLLGRSVQGKSRDNEPAAG